MILNKSLLIIDGDEAVIFKELQDDEKMDRFINLIQDSVQNDPVFDNLYSLLIANLLVSEKSSSRYKRSKIISFTLKSLSPVQLELLLNIDLWGGELSSDEISKILDIPKFELRSVVREMETLGLIKDVGKKRTIWRLRKMGKAFVAFVKKSKNT